MDKTVELVLKIKKLEDRIAELEVRELDAWGADHTLNTGREKFSPIPEEENWKVGDRLIDVWGDRCTILEIRYIDGIALHIDGIALPQMRLDWHDDDEDEDELLWDMDTFFRKLGPEE